VRFSNGGQLTDVVYTFDSICEPATHSAKAAGLRQMESITARDDYTVEMTTRGPYAATLEMAAYDIVPDGSALPVAGGALGPPGTRPFRPIRFEHDACDGAGAQRLCVIPRARSEASCSRLCRTTVRAKVKAAALICRFCSHEFAA
jgi:hypothetical protein